MSALESQAVGYGQGFAVTEHERGIAIVRCSARGLRLSVSSDGVTWTRESVKGEGAGALQPLCSGGGVRGVDLFCADASGRLVPVSARGGSLAMGKPFQPVASAPDWYESAPQPYEQTLIHDTRNNVYRGFFCARRSGGRHSERRGCIGLATSTDLSHWETEPPILAPNRHARLFSPHVSSHARRTVLFYATQEFGGHRALRFAVAPDLAGPYEIMDSNLLSTDVRSALQTVRMGKRTLVFFSRVLGGEHALPSVSRAGELDFRPDGRPFVRFHDALLRLLGRELLTTEADISSREMLVRMLPSRGRDFLLTADLCSLGAASLGVVFRATVTGHDNINLRLEFDSGTISLRRGVRGRLLARARQSLSAGTTYRLSLWAEHGFVDAYINDEWVLTGPTEDCRSGGFGLVVHGGEARFANVSARAIETA